MKKSKAVSKEVTKPKLSSKELNEVEFKITAALNVLYDKSPFYYHFLKFLPKKFDTKLGYAAAVAMHKTSKQIKLVINPERTQEYSVTDFVGLLQHESLHLCFEHLLDPKSKKRNIAMNFNKSCDYLINDHIPEVTTRYRRISDSLKGARGEIATLFNGQLDGKLTGHPDEIEKFMDEMSREDYEKVQEPLKAIVEKYKKIEPYTFWCTKSAIENIPEIKDLDFRTTTSEELYNILFKKEEGKGQGEGNDKQKMKVQICKGEPGDDHESMEGEGEEPIELDEMTKEEIKKAIKDAANDALSTQKTFGNMPSNLSKEIFEMLKSKTNYLQIIQSFATSVKDSDRTRTWTRQHRKYPNQTPGRRREYRPRILVGIDTSGSMWSEKIMTLIASEIKALKEICDSVILVMGDTQETARIDLNEKEFDAKNFKLQGGGGTDLQFIFDAAAQLGVDAIITHTDGFIPSFNNEKKIETLFFIYPGGQEVKGYRNVKIDECL